MEGTSDVLRHFPLFRFVYQDMKDNCQILYNFFEEQIAQHQKEFQSKSADEEPSDFVEAFLKQQRKLKIENVKEHFFS